MADSEAFGLIRERFAVQWGATTPIAWENVIFRPPQRAAWVRFAIRPDFAFQVDLNPSPRDRYPGMVFVQVFTPDGEGTEQGEQLAIAAADIYRRWSTVTLQGSILFRTPTVRHIGEDDGWSQYNVEAPFQFDSIHT